MAKKTLPNIHLASADDELRPALMHVEILDGIATATNGHIIARMNLKEYSTLPEETVRALSGKLIHRNVWDVIRDADLIEVHEDVIHYEKDGVKADYDISSTYQFPDYSGIIQAVANSKFDRKSFISFNPEHIVIAKKLFPAENLILRFYENQEMMVIFPSGEAKGFIGIMPLKITEKEATMDFSLA